MKIAVLGASGQIAKDYISHLSNQSDYQITAFVRKQSINRSIAMFGPNVNVRTYSDLENQGIFDLVVNCVGVGNPSHANLTDKSLVQTAKHFDALALKIAQRSSGTKYIFLSSGVAYGHDYETPVTSETIPRNIFDPTNPLDNYARVKFEIEELHRKMADQCIYDVRIFGYFTRTMDINSEFLIAKIAHSIVNNYSFTTGADSIVRDYSNGRDFALMVDAILKAPGRNMALDFYTKDPVEKFKLLEAVSEKFDLSYKIVSDAFLKSPTGMKPNYFSKNYVAQELGFIPPNSALENVLSELDLLISRY